jgi:hypothetical protein
MSTTSAVEFVIEPRSDRFDPDDPRWSRQVTDLCRTVRTEIGGFRREVSAVEGSKGGVETLILALGSAGAISGAVEAFRAWLGRSQDRSLTITADVNGQTRSFTVTGTGMTADDVRRFMEEALRQAAQ